MKAQHKSKDNKEVPIELLLRRYVSKGPESEGISLVLDTQVLASDWIRPAKASSMYRYIKVYKMLDIAELKRHILLSTGTKSVLLFTTCLRRDAGTVMFAVKASDVKEYDCQTYVQYFLMGC